MSPSDRLSDVEQHALLAVWRLREAAYGANIRDELARHTGRRLSISAIYVTLVRLEKRALLTSHIAPSTRERGGKGKRYFRIERRGMEALRFARAHLESLWEGLEAGGQERP